ncbi:MAG: AAA family ATPase, partial [Gammaproteobacteria bacterium]|nr:AAA family ATPase [Gammaproteobacteria bacterium]
MSFPMEHFKMSPSPLPLPQFLSFGVALCDALSELHKKDQIHTDIRPQNIHWDSENSKVELAHALEGGNPSLLIDIRLPYMSPEQTGRMNRRVDYHTDLYSLGVVFYELLTGEPPFLSEDFLEMIHNHIAKKPAPAHERNAEIPEQVSAIVMRLLEKNAEDRYQSALGLRNDLERCAKQLVSNGRVDRFELGESDLIGIFRIPEKLYGRDNEVKALLKTFERVSMGPAELLMVAGYSGVGKTALVHEVQKPIIGKHGFFIEGKFDQYHRNIPYFAWGQAFGAWVRQLLMESEFQLENWKSQILDAVGLNGKLIIDVIPNLEMVIGPQPAVPELDGQATQNRFNYVFQSFIKSIAGKEHPLVIFLDDLQWIDIASLNFLQSLLTDPGLANVLVIGAYRDNEVDAAHPLMMCVTELQEA